MATQGPYRGSCFCQLIVCLYIRCHFKHLLKVTCTSWRSVILEHYHRPFSIPRRSNVIQIQFLHVHHMIRTPNYPMPVLYALNRKNHAKIHYTGEPMYLNCGIKYILLPVQIFVAATYIHRWICRSMSTTDKRKQPYCGSREMYEYVWRFT